MAEIPDKGSQIAGSLTILGVILGVLASAFEPAKVNLYGAEVSKWVAAFLIPVMGLLLSFLLALLVDWADIKILEEDLMFERRSEEQKRAQLCPILLLITIPSIVALILHVIVLVAGIARLELGTPCIMFVAGILLFLLARILNSIQRNRVVGIVVIWTIRDSRVWESTHSLASTLYDVSALMLLVLAFVVPEGLPGILTIVGVFLLPTFVSIFYSYVIRHDESFIRGLRTSLLPSST